MVQVLQAWNGQRMLDLREQTSCLSGIQACLAYGALARRMVSGKGKDGGVLPEVGRADSHS
jgi:hypothetical protein